MNRIRYVLIMLLAAFILESPGQAASTDVISVAGNQLFRNGSPFLAKGVVFRFPLMPVHLLDVKPENASQKKYIAERKEARNFYYGLRSYAGKNALPYLRDWGVNAIRFNIFQASLDPQAPVIDSRQIYSEEYVQDVRRMVKRARARGFIVILTLYDAGLKIPELPPILYKASPGLGLATPTTLRAFRKLATMFKHDRGVLLETINEPYAPTKRKFGWAYWLNGGIVNGIKFIGMNQLIKAARGVGAKNVILLQPLKGSFHDFPGGLTDPENQLAFVSHPYFNHGTTEEQWNLHFGDFAVSNPVVAEWNADTREGWCNSPSDADAPSRFLAYMKRRAIGIMGFAFDVKGTIVEGYNGVPTVWSGQCGLPGGPGEMLKDYFLSP